MPTYDYRCLTCEHEQITNSSYDQRDEPKVCDNCGEEAERVFIYVNIRTAKLSSTFLAPTSAGGGRSGEDLRALNDLKAAQRAEELALKQRPGTEEYRQLKKEARERKKVRK